jgi:hypothetical protein
VQRAREVLHLGRDRVVDVDHRVRGAPLLGQMDDGVRLLVVEHLVDERIVAEVTLVDRRLQKPVWKTTKSDGTYDTNRLADDIIEQLKKDFRKSASEY